MNDSELCKKRLLDLSRQAECKQIVLFSDFLNLNEQNIYHATQREFYTGTECFGGYEGCERQMIAFIPDALYYEWEYPIKSLVIRPKYPKFAEELSHRDVLGALMHLGIDRRMLGDIVKYEQGGGRACGSERAEENSAGKSAGFAGNFYLLFCEEGIASFLLENLTKIRHTEVALEPIEKIADLDFKPKLEEHFEVVASNRIDAVIAKAYHLSRTESNEYLTAEKVFMNGKCITNCNQSCENGAILSVRGKGRFLFETDNSINKKGKLRVKLSLYV